MRSTQLKIGIAAAMAAVGALTVGSLAGAAPSETEQKLESARDEAQLITDRINSKSAEIAELEQRAADAAAREQELLAQLRESTARSTALNDDLLAAERELEAVRARYKRSVGVLADRLVEIYKGSDVDYLVGGFGVRWLRRLRDPRRVPRGADRGRRAHRRPRLGPERRGLRPRMRRSRT